MKTAKKFIFFTLNNFTLDGGGRVRIYGILNALAKDGKEVILISNCIDTTKFHTNIKHIPFDFNLSIKQKKIFQLFLAIFPNFVNKVLFQHYIKHFKNKIPQQLQKEIIFLEYLDNSLGYFYKKNKCITSYINDIHGIAPLEFKNNKAHGIKKIYNLLRYKVAIRLDQKVMKSATKIIVVSEAMKEYFLNEYSFLQNKIIIIRDGVSKEFCDQPIDKSLLHEITQKYKNDGKKIIFFAGNFKDLGGVLDLINAFILLTKKREDIKLLLIGDGEHFKEAKQIIKNVKLNEVVYFLGRVPYSKLKTYQQIANVIVCPDKQHPYSELVPHIKYFDALTTNKIVINGKFKSITEINKEEFLSINFEPSNINDLALKINLALNNAHNLNMKYKNNAKYVCAKLTYENFISYL